MNSQINSTSQAIDRTVLTHPHTNENGDVKGRERTSEAGVGDQTVPLRKNTYSPGPRQAIHAWLRLKLSRDVMRFLNRLPRVRSKIYRSKESKDELSVCSACLYTRQPIHAKSHLISPRASPVFWDRLSFIDLSLPSLQRPSSSAGSCTRSPTHIAHQLQTP